MSPTAPLFRSAAAEPATAAAQAAAAAAATTAVFAAAAERPAQDKGAQQGRGGCVKQRKPRQDRQRDSSVNN